MDTLDRPRLRMIHPALSEVVREAFDNLMDVSTYHHDLEEHTDIFIGEEEES